MEPRAFTLNHIPEPHLFICLFIFESGSPEVTKLPRLSLNWPSTCLSLLESCLALLILFKDFTLLGGLDPDSAPLHGATRVFCCVYQGDRAPK